MSKTVVGLDVCVRELAERVGELETTNSLGERFSQLEHQLAVRQGTLLSQDQLLEKIEVHQRQLDELKTVVGLDTCVRELAERVGDLEQTHSLEARFAKLVDEASKRESEIPYSELLIKVEGLQHIGFMSWRRSPLNLVLLAHLVSCRSCGSTFRIMRTMSANSRRRPLTGPFRHRARAATR